MAVQDPTFWKRFSIAVHQDDAAKQEMAQHAELKHSYVISLADMPSPTIIRPTSEAHLLRSHPRPLSPAVLSPHSPTTTHEPSSPSSTSHIKPLKKAYTPQSTKSTPFARHGNGSQLTLAFSGQIRGSKASAGSGGIARGFAGPSGYAYFCWSEAPSRQSWC
ncbi:uncharacterized protein CC84DRAFT_1262037 [Paraphaeosphaeria sporulosa]|uniref:Uncharacterized protein n=1 Tax=Paraphaeosphaeria sporulosa TaxID=1460663 RepID=A0A177C5K7_9PLEO|nr:uncharacterized protein CC84DRAFT_1262037 [Paraphaeosphaeria sporulosa]OAG02007.1 hypothetical protein CC84DRAFT_1262037 [Paraphaeosphaeria sporulosa]